SADHTMLISYFQTKSLGSYKAFMTSVDPIVTAAKAQGLTTYVTGTIPLSVRTEYHLTHDVTRLLALAALIVLLTYIAGFRSVRGVALPLLSTLLGTLWTVGFMGVTGYSLSLITIVAPPLILIFGNEYSIYTTSEYLRVARVEGIAPGWIERAAHNVAKPITMAFLTTMIGYLSLLFTSIRQTREFAIAATFGSLSCAFLALFFLPALYALLRPPVTRQPRTSVALENVMAAVARFTWRFPAAVLVIVVASAVLFFVTAPRLVFNTDPAGYFPQNDPVLRDMSAIYGKVGGYEQVSVSFDAPQGAQGYFLSADALARVEAVERKLREIPDISYSVSLPGLLRDINKAATGEDAIPTNRAVISTFSRLLVAAGSSSPTGAVIGTLANKDFTRVTVAFRIWNSTTGHYMDEARFRTLVASMNKVLADNPTGAKAVVWSDLLRNLSFADSLRGSLFISMVFSVLLVFVLTVLVFRSPFMGLYAIVPLATGLLLNFAMMALARIPLDMTTIMVSNIAIGEGVDSAIYMIIQYRRELEQLPDDPRGALVQTLRVMGQPVLLSCLAIVFGLMTFLAADFRPIMFFGALVLFTLAATTVGILVILPALLAMDTRARRTRAARRREASGSA
ncbi:MAG TPA: MMPL family transporter, partial [Spirochaetia bacterium]